MSKDYYKILGVAEFDSAENIKNAYRKLARKWHPDVAGTSAEVLEKFKEINEANEILSDPDKRKQYDFELENPGRGAFGGFGGGQMPNFGGGQMPSGGSGRPSGSGSSNRPSRG